MYVVSSLVVDSVMAQTGPCWVKQKLSKSDNKLGSASFLKIK